MADSDLLYKILVSTKTLYFFGNILVAITPTLIFLLGCCVLVGQFIKKLIGTTEGTSIIEIVITGSIVIQLMRLWTVAVTSVELLAELICHKLLEECNLLTKTTIFQEACTVLNPRVSCFLACTAMSLVPWSVFAAWNAVYQYRLRQDLIAWIRLSRWSRTEMGMSIYFLENPVNDEQVQRELMNHGRVRGKRRSKDRHQRNLTRSTSTQNCSDPNNTSRLKTSQSV
ncbi:hypothetical protein LSTR_LSTR010684 [Laodelphax striatellus]|uniref:Uncharacterized protein n=1 Tax=Laodelphax striatellus TaxID=195883 RepID=A0A482WSU9_LAOST|nr:hypothetical protein LSTR_LSTR010684 [Laodelphax striatellus]